jgi:hypothetical protein
MRAGRRRGAALLALALVVCAACNDGLRSYLPPPALATALCIPPTEIPPPPAVRGANLIGFHESEYRGPAARAAASLDDLAARGANWVAINFWWFQATAASTEIAPDPSAYTISDEAIATAIQAAHAAGLRVLLRPMLDVRDGTPRRFLQPSPTWFAQYRAYLARYAERATTWGADAFSLGAELALTEPQDTEWRAVVAAIRARYSGPLIYCAVADTAADVTWWDAVDIIGVDVYNALTLDAAPSLAELTCAWSYWFDVLECDLAARHPGQPVWLAEIGVRSARGAARLSWCFDDPCGGLVDWQTMDLAGQATYYRAALLAAGHRPWLAGVLWWAWNADPTGDDVSPTDFTPQGKPAADVLAEFWLSGSPAESR